MSGEEEQGSVAGFKPRGELGELVDHALAAEVAPSDHIEAEPRERVADRFRIIHSFLQHWQICIAVVADDEGDLLFRLCGSAAKGRDTCNECDEEVAHRYFLMRRA